MLTGNTREKKVLSIKVVGEKKKKVGYKKLITRGCFLRAMMKQLYQNNLPQKQNNIYVVKLLKQYISGSNQVNQDLRGQPPKGREISRSELCFRLLLCLLGAFAYSQFKARNPNRKQWLRTCRCNTRFEK